MIGEYKALYENEDGEWELKNASRNSDDSFKVGNGDYLPKPKEHIRTLKLRTLTGSIKRYKFFVIHSENPAPVDLRRTPVDVIDTSTMVRSFRRAHIVESLGRASRELPGKSKQMDMAKIILICVGAAFALILYYTGVFEQLFDWLTSAP